MILGTAGHIDHGKTALVRALTGVDTDRLPEEKRRGITIELGYAPLELDGVGTIGIVDVPGHEAFVRTMLAGATGVDLALLVVAADEGVMPQTREHLAILSLLGVSAGVVALTKSDLVEGDWLDLVEADVRDALAGGPLHHATIVRCSARTGAGLDALRDAIRAAAAAVPARAADDLFRMPIDRVFTVKGTGTVVTGTIWTGTLAADDTVAILPAAHEARVRGIESHGRTLPMARTGSRTAVALVGVDRASIDAHGATLVRAGDPWAPGTLLRADVALLAGAPVLGPRTRVRLHLGTAEVGARLVAVGGPVSAGRPVPVRVALDAPLAARAGDRFVIRTASPAATIGGGVVTDPAPPRRRTRPFPSSGAAPAERLRLMLAEAGGQGMPVGAIPVRIGVRPVESAALLDDSGIVRAGERCFAAQVLASACAAGRAAIDAYHARHPLDAGSPVQALRDTMRTAVELADRAIADLVASGAVSVSDGVVARVGWVAGGAVDAARISRVLDTLRAAGAQPPSVDELSAELGADTLAVLKLLARRGDAVAVASDRYFAADAVRSIEAVVVRALTGSTGKSTSELREITGLTRKFIIPILEYFDRVGVTVRRGDVRVAGKSS
ncbi:MAG TPA: selenocysteine-specific translation elongation factor [Gemmatimonadaceae bacterium]|nr:selenocysteine-specific translation elongation factor [Gemmatimonadaceae bacterium]